MESVNDYSVGKMFIIELPFAVPLTLPQSGCVHTHSAQCQIAFVFPVRVSEFLLEESLFSLWKVWKTDQRDEGSYESEENLPNLYHLTLTTSTSSLRTTNFDPIGWVFNPTI